MKNLVKMVEKRQGELKDLGGGAGLIRCVTKEIHWPHRILRAFRKNVVITPSMLGRSFRESITLNSKGEITLERLGWLGSPKLEVGYTSFDEIKAVRRFDRNLRYVDDFFGAGGRLEPTPCFRNSPNPLPFTERQARRFTRRYGMVNGPQGRELLQELAQKGPR